MVSVAVSFRRGNQPGRAAIGLQVPTSRWTEEREEDLVGALQRAAQRLSDLAQIDRLPGG